MARLGMPIISTGLTFVVSWAAQSGQSVLIHPGTDGKLVYVLYTKDGDTIPDFSQCGYRGGRVAIPFIVVRETLLPEAGGDDGPRIQAAIDRVSAMAPDPASGFRGAVLLKRGDYRVGQPLSISTDGVILRGEEDGGDGTVLTATFRERSPLIKVGGASGKVGRVKGTRQAVIDSYIPVGARNLTVADSSAFRAGDPVLVIRLANDAWITTLKMDRIGRRESAHPRRPDHLRN
jgi:hypothetical protein